MAEGSCQEQSEVCIPVAGGHTFAFAGLWSAWKDPANGQWLNSFAILTTDPNKIMEPVHNRMPVILHRSDYQRWLSREKTAPPIDLLRPFEANAMEVHRSGSSPMDELFELNSR